MRRGAVEINRSSPGDAGPRMSHRPRVHLSTMPRKPTRKKPASEPPPPPPPPPPPARSLQEIREESRRLIDAGDDTLRRLRELQSEVIEQVAKLEDSRAESEAKRKQHPKS